ncbi:hypothetical protein Tco_0448595 [Tanacetum coccineum]
MCIQSFLKVIIVISRLDFGVEDGAYGLVESSFLPIFSETEIFYLLQSKLEKKHHQGPNQSILQVVVMGGSLSVNLGLTGWPCVAFLLTSNTSVVILKLLGR